MGNIDTTRQVRNTAYSEQIKEVTVHNLDNYVCENGALIKWGEQIFVGISGQWVKIAPIIGIGSYQFQKSSDNQYNFGNPFNFTSNTEYVLPNNAAHNVIYHDAIYKAGKFSLISGTNYILKVSFFGHLNNNNGHMEIYLEDSNGNLFDQCSDIITFPKGNGIEHKYSKLFFINCELNDEIELKFKPSHNGSLYTINFEIQTILQYA